MLLYGNLLDINNASGAPAPITVPSTTVVYSRSFQINYGQVFGLWYQAGNGSGTANMKIQLQQSYRAPTTEGSADPSYVIGSGVPDIETNLNDTTAHVKTMSPVPMKFARFRIEGLGTNPADATILIKLFQQNLSG